MSTPSLKEPTWRSCAECRKYYAENAWSLREAIASCAIEGNTMTLDEYMKLFHKGAHRE